MIKKQPPVRNTPLVQEHTPRPSTQQFNATPRFNFSSTPRPTATQNFSTATPSTTRYLTLAGKLPNEQDAIDTSSDDVLQNVQDSIETEDHDIDLGYLSTDVEDDYEIEERGAKRRKVSSSPQDVKVDDFAEDDDEDNHDQNDSMTSSLPILSSPPAPRRPISTTAPRFLHSTPALPSASLPSNTQQTTFLKPPRFRPPDPSEQEQTRTDPLPDQFSPHRRGQKYLAGGLAAEVRDWLVNIDSAIPASAAQKIKDDPWTVKIVVDEISGGGRTGMTLVRGRQVYSDGGVGIVDYSGVVKVILAGEGAATGLQKAAKVEVGKIVGVKGPAWEVMIEGEKWGVGVDWKVFMK